MTMSEALSAALAVAPGAAADWPSVNGGLLGYTAAFWGAVW